MELKISHTGGSHQSSSEIGGIYGWEVPRGDLTLMHIVADALCAFLHVFYLFNPCSIFCSMLVTDSTISRSFAFPLGWWDDASNGCSARNEQPQLPQCSGLRISMLWKSLNVCWIPGYTREPWGNVQTRWPASFWILPSSRRRHPVLWLQKFDEVDRCHCDPSHGCLQVYREVLNYNSSLAAKIQGSYGHPVQV